MSARSAIVVWVALSALLWLAIGTMTQFTGLWRDAIADGAGLSDISPAAGPTRP